MSTKYFTPEDAYELDKDLKRTDVKLLQEWMSKQPHLPQISELMLIHFLHSCYYKLEATKTCIDNFYTLKAHWPEFSLERNVFSDSMRQTFQMLLSTILPLRTKHNHTIAYGRFLDSNPAVFDHLNFLKAFDMIMLAWTRIVGICEGIVLIMDTEGIVFGHFVKLNILFIKKYMYYVQDAVPIRLKAVHVINVPPVFHKALNLTKPFIKNELMDMIHLHSKMDSLYEHAPKASLPNELGGEAGTFQELHDKQMDLLKENAEYLMAGEKEIADESRRLEKSKYYDEHFGGVEGTFKKLDID